MVGYHIHQVGIARIFEVLQGKQRVYTCVYVFVNLGNENAEVKYTGNAPAPNETTINFFTGATEASTDATAI